MHRLFPSQRGDENIYLVLRVHWFVLFLRILAWLIFVAALILFNRFGKMYLPGLFEGDIGQITRLFIQVYVLFLILSLFLIWVFYYLNAQIVTNMRIVDIDQTGLFAHTVSELHIENIEDVTSETNGLFGTLFNYGMVYVQTAGSRERFEFDNVPNPGAVEKLILDIYSHLPRERTEKVRRRADIHPGAGFNL